MRIAFLTRSLEVGGAERQLTLLARGLHQRGHQVEVVSLYPGGDLAGHLTTAGVPVHNIHKKGRWDLIGFYKSLASLLRKQQPQVLYSFLDVPNLVSIALRPALCKVKVVWGIRAAFMDFARYDRFSALVNRLTYPASRWAHGIVLNSWSAQQYHGAKGLPQAKLKVIPNGIDTAQFSYDQEGGRLMRERWGIVQGQSLLGLSGRLDPMKDHANFLKAACIIRAARPDARFVCIGGGDPACLAGLEKQAESLGLSEAVVWAGEISDMPAAYSALDIAVSASSGESFSNVVAEAMACQRPVAVTDVGDSARIVGPVGKVAPAGDAAALAGACLELLSLDETGRQDLGAALKQRVEQEYSVGAMLTASETYLTSLLAEES